MGLVSPLGASLWATYRALLEGRTLADRLASVPQEVEVCTPEGLLSFVRCVGGVPGAWRSPYDPSVSLGELAAHEALRDAALDILEARRMPMVIASSKGAVNAIVSPHAPTQRGASVLSPHGFLAHHLRARLGGVSPCSAAVPATECVVAACASGVAALDRAIRILVRMPADQPARVLVVGVESALHALFIHSYRNLGVLAPISREAYAGKPLAPDRHGFVLNEVAAAMVLERSGLTPSDPDDSRPGLRLLGTRRLANGSHLVRSGDAQPAIEELGRWSVRTLRLAGRSMDAGVMLHPHATGTMEHDAAELGALARAMGHDAELVSAYAVKGALGHGLGASGLVSAVIAGMIARHARVPAMPWLRAGNVQTPFRLHVSGGRGTWPLHAVFASGFGGHAACALLATY